MSLCHGTFQHEAALHSHAASALIFAVGWGVRRYRSPHGGLVDVELELQFDAEALLSAVGLKHLADTAFSSKVWFAWLEQCPD